jgi:hypothetical protein
MLKAKEGIRATTVSGLLNLNSIEQNPGSEYPTTTTADCMLVILHEIADATLGTIGPVSRMLGAGTISKAFRAVSISAKPPCLRRTVTWQSAGVCWKLN